MSEISEVEALIAKKKWKAAHDRLLEELTLAPSDHWLWMQLSLTSYEQHDYEKAETYARRAVELQPDCPLALWHYAGSLSMTGKEDTALAVWLLILGMDLERVAHGECGEGMDWAMQLVNDVHYRMGRLYQHQGKRGLARASFQKYLHNRSHGVGSIYEIADAKKHLAAVSPAPAAP
jgi:tetratricopeptide (TPR) repeat protein